MNRAIIYFTLFVGYFFLRNIFMPLSDDDFAYAFIWDGEHGGNLNEMLNFSEEFRHRERVESLADIFKSQCSHYLTWGGRIVAHFLAQIFIWIGKFYFDIANTIIFAAFIILIFKLSDTPFKKSEFALGWIFFIMFFVAAKISSCVIWMTWLTGACSYFWMTVFQFAFLLPYVNAIRSKKFSKSRLKIFCMAIFGIFAGCSNEAGSLATIFLTGILTLLAVHEKIFQKWMAVGFITLALGSGLCILAPGNFAQTEFIRSVNPAFNFSAELLKNNFVSGFLPVFGLDLTALLPTIIYFFRRGLGKLNTSEILSLAFAGAGFIIPLSMIFSPKFDIYRIATISLPFMIVSAVIAYNELKNFSRKISLPPIFRVGIFVSCLLYSTSIIYSYVLLSEGLKNQLNIIVESNANETVYLPPMPSLSPMQKFLEKIHGADCPASYVKYYGGITTDKNNYVNIMAVQYYGVKAIVGSE